MEITLGDVGALLGGLAGVGALVVSIIALWRTSRLNELQERLNTLWLEREEREAARATQPDLGATFVKISKHQHRLRLYNKGKAPAYQVELAFPEGNGVVSTSSVSAKFPMEIMEPGDSVDVLASFALGSAQKQAVEIHFADPAGKRDSKTVYPTL